MLLRLFFVAALCFVQTEAFFKSISPRNLHRLAPSTSENECLQPRPSQSRSALEMSSTTEEFKFESNVARVMDIIINSLYSNKDVFLRELVSNAADACDKRRFKAISTGEDVSNIGIRVYADREANTLTIEDKGIGMTKEEIVQNLGRIAESGTRRFLEASEKKEELSLIGQFGVGFYSGFLVADKMTVVTKSAQTGDKQMKWEASADSLDGYKISDDDSGQPIDSPSGTRITLHLKDESDQYLDDIALKSLLEKYSEFVQFPIELLRKVSKPEQVPDTEKGPDEDGTMPMKTVMNKVDEWKIVNTKKPLWLRTPKDCTDEEYDEFYRQTFNAFDKPAAKAHFSVEGNVDFKALLYLPSEVPYELSRDMFATGARSMRLYVKRVFINDKFEDLIPRWLLFISGVIDSDDLPLNVGREILQQSRSLRIIKQRLVKQSIRMFNDIAKNETEYSMFWKRFGKYIKVGIIEDEKAKDDLIPLCRFYSSTSGNDMTSLPNYVERMKEDQKLIYYVVGESKAQAAISPAIEKVASRGYEVIYVSEPVDEMTLQNIEKFMDKQIVDIGKETMDDLSEEEKKEKDEKNEDFEGLRTWMQNVLQGKVVRVECSTRLVDSPATLVQSEFGVSPNMQKYLRAQSVVDEDGKGEFSNIFNQAVLEINPSHPIITKLKTIQEVDGESEDSKEMVDMVFNTAALAAGYMLDNSAEYSKMVVKMMTKVAQN